MLNKTYQHATIDKLVKFGIIQIVRSLSSDSDGRGDSSHKKEGLPLSTTIQSTRPRPKRTGLVLLLVLILANVIFWPGKYFLSVYTLTPDLRFVRCNPAIHVGKPRIVYPDPKVDHWEARCPRRVADSS